MPELYENETKEDIELEVASQANDPIYYPQIIGQFAGGSPTDYGNPRLKEVHVAPGQDIQKALDGLKEAGGGVLRLLAGTHLPLTDLSVSSDITILGEGIESTIIDFNGNASNINFLGTLRTSAGTITVTEGSATIAGVSTTFTNYSVDDLIFLTPNDLNFQAKITAIASDTSMTIEDAWPMPTISGSSSYIVFDAVRNSGIKNLSIKNSANTTASLQIRRVSNFIGENVFVYKNTVSRGISIIDIIDSEFRNIESSYNGTSTSDDGFGIGSSKRTSFYNCSAIGNGYAGFNLFSGGSNEENTFYSCLAEGNTQYGFLNNSGASGNSFISCKASGNDDSGFAIYASRAFLLNCYSLDNGDAGIELNGSPTDVMILNCRLVDNDAYGIDLVGGLANRTNIIAPFFSGNTSGTLRDNGINTHYSNTGYGTFTAANGANNNIDVGENKIVRISGPTAAFNITGVTNTANAKSVILYNTTAQNMTITNQATSDDTQQILTGTGADVATTGIGQVGLYYDATDKKWILVGINS